MAGAALILRLAEIYGGIGAVIAAIFLSYGIERVDPAARGAYAFRPLLIPGLIILWPLVLWRWRALERRQG